mgnify:CR=1 FL=1
MWHSHPSPNLVKARYRLVWVLRELASSLEFAQNCGSLFVKALETHLKWSWNSSIIQEKRLFKTSAPRHYSCLRRDLVFTLRIRICWLSSRETSTYRVANSLKKNFEVSVFLSSTVKCVRKQSTAVSWIGANWHFRILDKVCRKSFKSKIRSLLRRKKW